MVKSNQSSFMEHYLLIKIEGFKQQEFISQCMKKNITLREIKIRNNIEMTLKIKETDLEGLRGIGRNKYKITIINEGGYIKLLSSLLTHKARICGILLFIFIIYFQTLFISEIRISGYERFTESEIRECLKQNGFFEGCRNNLDLEKQRLLLYDKLDHVSFVSINTRGCLAEIEIVEGTINLEKVDKSKPCDIVANKEGYVYRIVPTEGIRNVDAGTYVKKGDVVIAGTIPIESTTYGQPENNITERYVHAEGSVLAKIPYRFVYNQSLYETVKKDTGKFFLALDFKIGNKEFSTEELFNPYEVSAVESVNKFHGIRPFPFSITLSKVKEIELEARKRSQSDIEKEVNKLVRQEIKEKLPEKTQILNKSLYFAQEKNIIEVSVMIESLQEIGTEQEIAIGEQNKSGKEASN